MSEELKRLIVKWILDQDETGLTEADLYDQDIYDSYLEAKSVWKRDEEIIRVLKRYFKE